MGQSCTTAIRSRNEADIVEQAKIERMRSSVRRQGFTAEKVTDEKLSSWKAPVTPKSEEVIARIRNIIVNNEKLKQLFGDFTTDPTSLRTMIGAMKAKEISAGETVITQGEPGDVFYIVEEGTFDILVSRGDQAPAKVLECGPGTSFGELALMWNSPRAATVIATSHAKCWCLDRESFRMMIVSSEVQKKREYESFLEKVPVLKELNRFEICRLAEILSTQDYAANETIVKQGSSGDRFYILASGSATAFIEGGEGRFAVKSYERPGDFFGEIALVSDAPRKASVLSGADGCRVLSVSKADFDRVLGPIKENLRSQIHDYPAYEAFAT